MATVVDTREEQRRRAWEAYAEAVRDRHGADYDDAEQTAWEQLQEMLAALDTDRTASSTPPVG
jgi:hypothetical protein